LSAVDIKEKTIWIVDDMIDTGDSIYHLVRELHKRDVKSISIAAVHPVFSEPAAERLKELYQTGMLKEIIVTDTIICPEGLQKDLPILRIIPSTALTAQIISALHVDKSLTKFFLDFDAKKDFEDSKLFV
jgi:ribose-phosphate pyrophosphokinase